MGATTFRLAAGAFRVAVLYFSRSGCCSCGCLRRCTFHTQKLGTSGPPWNAVNKCDRVTPGRIPSPYEARDVCDQAFYKKPDGRDVKCIWKTNNNKCREDDSVALIDCD